MKRKFSYHIFFLSVIAMLGCTGNPKKEANNGGDEPVDTSVSTVLYPLDSARYAMQHFDNLSNAFFHALDSVDGTPVPAGDSIVPIKAFTIRAVDVLAALGLPPELAATDDCKYKHLRVYLGYTNQFKLLIVPVTGADISNGQGGEDLLLNSNGVAIQPGEDPNGPTYVLDLNAPCPNTCAVNNVLR